MKNYTSVFDKMKVFFSNDLPLFFRIELRIIVSQIKNKVNSQLFSQKRSFFGMIQQKCLFFNNFTKKISDNILIFLKEYIRIYVI